MVNVEIQQTILLVVLAVAFCKLAASSLVVQEAGLRVLYPVVRDINMSMADFGMPRYGGFLKGELVYLSSSHRYYRNKTYLCPTRQCQYACDYNMKLEQVSIRKEPGTTYVMLVDRGPRHDDDQKPCFFLDKVYNAQLAGADAVLVADDTEEDLATAVAPEDSDTAGELNALTISAAVISKSDADFLRLMLQDGNNVTVLLNWSESLPQSRQVRWEYWTGSADGCGAVCDKRVNFSQAIKDEAIKLEQAGLTSFTPRYFLYDCKEGTDNLTECLGNCFSKGRYCALPVGNSSNKDASSSGYYSGKEVLRMNIRSKCFYKQAAESGKTYKWWEYRSSMFNNCTMAKKTFTIECATKVFDEVIKDTYMGDRKTWETCATNFNETDEKIPILEEELLAQYGNMSAKPPIAPVTIEPTIRINGQQYRGSLEDGPVLRALCAAFPTFHEPEFCNSKRVSEDECEAPNGAGYIKCHVSDPGSRNGCINTFQGYQCTCGSGFQLMVADDDPLEVCSDINECAISRAPYRNSNCSCDRCACINTIGSYTCTGLRENQCTEKNKYGGCWFEDFNTLQGKKTFTTCVDTISEYINRSYRGLVADNDTWHKCSNECPKCFDSTEGGKCRLRCSNITQCDEVSGYCRDSSQDAAGNGMAGGGGGGGKSSGGGGGVHPGFMVLVALGAAALTGGVVMAANHIIMKKRMSDEVRDIMSAYMPLTDERARKASATAARGHGGDSRGDGGYQQRVIRPDEDSDEEGGLVGSYGWSAAATTTATNAPPYAAPLGGGPSVASVPDPKLVGASSRGVWGPPPAGVATSTTTLPSTALKPLATTDAAAASTATKPIVDVFVSGGAAKERLPVVAAVANKPGADPLLGRQLSNSGNSNLPLSSVPGGEKRDNPFM